MTDKLVALLALLTLAGFLGILAWRVPEFDLLVVLVLCLVLAAVDVGLTLFARKPKQQRPLQD